MYIEARLWRNSYQEAARIVLTQSRIPMDVTGDGQSINSLFEARLRRDQYERDG
jgi:hypothetical protein